MTDRADRIRALAEREAAWSVAALGAAETSVEQGRLNLAKVLRASALASRQRALVLHRLASQRPPASVAADRASAIHEALSGIADIAAAPGQESAVDAVRQSLESEQVVVGKAVEALAASRDVPESVVAPLLWACEECGFIAEEQRPEVCPCCGTFGGEFALLAPFFASSAEHLARRQPDTILASLDEDAGRLRAALAGVHEGRLLLRNAPGEWCIKEIAGHMVDVAELACRRLRPVVDPQFVPPRERTPLPWKLLEGQNYPSQPVEGIAAHFERALADARGMFADLTPRQWRSRVDLVSGRTAAIDVGSWLVNHNRAHLQQIIALAAGA